MFTVVGVDQNSLTGVEALAMIARKSGPDAISLERLVAVSVLDKFEYFQVVDVDRIKAFLHGRNVDFVSGVFQVSGRAGVTAGHLGIGDCPDLSFFIDEIRPDAQLSRLLVDHAVGRCTSDALGSNDLL